MREAIKDGPLPIEAKLRLNERFKKEVSMNLKTYLKIVKALKNIDPDGEVAKNGDAFFLTKPLDDQTVEMIRKHNWSYLADSTNHSYQVFL